MHVEKMNSIKEVKAKNKMEEAVKRHYNAFKKTQDAVQSISNEKAEWSGEARSKFQITFDNYFLAISQTCHFMVPLQNF